MKKSLIFSGMILGILINAGIVQATPVPGTGVEGNPEDYIRLKATLTNTDPGRTLTGFIATIIGLVGDGEAKAQLIAQQDENNQGACGKGGSANKTDTSSGKLVGTGAAGGSEFTGSAFEYVKTNILDKDGNVDYAPLKTALASAETGNAVRENVKNAVLKFFANPDDNPTTEDKENIRKARNEYAQKAANRHVTLGYKVKGHIQNDLLAISSAAVSGDGELGSIAVDAHTLEQMVKMELVDLALQIEMMEADAIQFLMHQPVELMSETKPTS